MTLSYRTRRNLKGLAMGLLIALMVAMVIWLCWILWLERYIVYTRDGVKLDLSLSIEALSGEVAKPPENTIDVEIYYNDGQDAISTSTELTQLSGFYADGAALGEDLADVRARIQSLPAGTPVMLDVKNIYGAFYYSSSLGSSSSSVDTGAMNELIQYLKSSNLYVIARLPAFRDYSFGLANVPYGLPLEGGYLYMDDDNCYWLNPSSEGTLSFLEDILAELQGLGFDEVVFTDFRFPDTSAIVFSGDRDQALAAAAQTLVKNCATSTFAVSFAVDSPTFPLPEGRSRIYLSGTDAASVHSLAQATGLPNPEIRLVFLTELKDTRFDACGVLRPISMANLE